MSANVCLSQFPSTNFLRNFPKEAQVVTGWVWVGTQYHTTTDCTDWSTRHISTGFVFWQKFPWTLCQVNIFNRNRLPWKGMKFILRGGRVGRAWWWLAGREKYSQHCSCWERRASAQSGLRSAWEINKIGRFIVAESGESFERKTF